MLFKDFEVITIFPEKVGFDVEKVVMEIFWHVVLTKTFKNGIFRVPNFQIICCKDVVVHSYFNGYALVWIDHLAIFVLQGVLRHSSSNNSIFVDVSRALSAGCSTRAH